MPTHTTWQPHTAHGALDAARRDDLPDSVFAFPRQRKEPLTDAAHVRAALARFDQVEDVSDADRALAFANIKKAARRKLPGTTPSRSTKRTGSNWGSSPTPATPRTTETGPNRPGCSVARHAWAVRDDLTQHTQLPDGLAARWRALRGTRDRSGCLRGLRPAAARGRRAGGG